MRNASYYGLTDTQIDIYQSQFMKFSNAWDSKNIYKILFPNIFNIYAYITEYFIYNLYFRTSFT